MLYYMNTFYFSFQNYTFYTMKTRAKLGQHFLRSQKALGQIIDAADIHSNDIVLEIGPGKGALTAALLKKAERVIAIEKDPALVDNLRTQFHSELACGKLTLIADDIRHFDASQYFGEKPYKVVANIPYYITGELLRTFLSAEKQPELIVFLIQKEVAVRIARDKKESILSLSVKIYGDPKYVATVPQSAFSPPPQVDSAILLISNTSRKKLGNIDEKRFFELIKSGFAQKRKFLKGNLEKLASPNAVLSAFRELEINERTRAEDVPFDTWIKLAEKFSK